VERFDCRGWNTFYTERKETQIESERGYRKRNEIWMLIWCWFIRTGDKEQLARLGSFDNGRDDK
jgi:hypothetical protein